MTDFIICLDQDWQVLPSLETALYDDRNIVVFDNNSQNSSKVAWWALQSEVILKPLVKCSRHKAANFNEKICRCIEES
jgi:hypothetical protein